MYPPLSARHIIIIIIHDIVLNLGHTATVADGLRLSLCSTTNSGIHVRCEYMYMYMYLTRHWYLCPCKCIHVLKEAVLLGYYVRVNLEGHHRCGLYTYIREGLDRSLQAGRQAGRQELRIRSATDLGPYSNLLAVREDDRTYLPSVRMN